ncbi:MAG TPA: hypothetical protein DDY24_06905 [Alcaligenaceae bacterium]|nr:hypothetical protein [Alcaligenaceae bacterium]
MVIAKEQARVEVDAERLALIDERTAITSERSNVEAQLSQLKTDRDAAIQANDAASLRQADLQRLIDHQALQLADLVLQRDRALSEVSRIHADLVKQQLELQQRQQAWDTARSSLEATHVAMQDRWLGEVDRARQDETKLATKLKQLEHASELSTRKAAEQISDLSKRLVLAERDDAKKTSKMSSLEDEVKRLHTQLKVRLQVKPAVVARPTKKAIKTN